MIFSVIVMLFWANYKFVDNDELKRAIHMWYTSETKAMEKYGHISTWDTSSITEMEDLFNGKKKFNEDICILFPWYIDIFIKLCGIHLLLQICSTLFCGIFIDFGNMILYFEWYVSKCEIIQCWYWYSYIIFRFEKWWGRWDTSSVTNMRYFFCGIFIHVDNMILYFELYV